MSTRERDPSLPLPPGTVREVFGAFLLLGLTSFGGPVAHLGYFREAFVERRRWLTDAAYADVVALCQFLPGPASSQVGMALGLQRAGLPGLIAAWVGFTLPSAVLLVAFAFGVAALGDAAGTGWIAGLKAAAVAVVAHAVIAMARTLAPDARRAGLAAAGAVVVLLAPHPGVQVAVIVAGALAGLALMRGPAAPDAGTLGVHVSRPVAVGALALFAVLLAGLPIAAAVTGNGAVALAETFYRAGSLVFGGGHVVLPLLEADMVPTSLVDRDAFLAGYGAAQAVPGPLFTFAGFLGASTTTGPTGLLGAGIALLAIFLPAALLTVGVLPFWDRLRQAPKARAALAGVNAVVVGILGAALYDPVFTAGITSAATMALAVAVFAAQRVFSLPAWAAVLGAGLVGWVFL
ncbi:chromate efflux transporter [Zhihengliuella flava]|uniref:Chromate transporter n=1 Tax=Zhihengliuella flava TaxID=1285193 RepID=A0A931GFN7_9MICC|nr:chromate efflux transporter [Zhihengliuella flava]MBG6084857.1 chromate transporter [Zhihengliuella flava]